MININGKQWNQITKEDIEILLEGDNDENFFFEYKNDDVDNKKLIKEISAFSNTYGGYIIIGVDDDKKILGCSKWNEQKIHTTIHDSITPIPNFDVKKVSIDEEKNIYIIKIEEGSHPPYITNTGKIYERVSSGSFPINESSKLIQLYYKREDQNKKIKNKIEIEDINNVNNLPNNLCGYVDVGFSITVNDSKKLQKKIFNIDLEELSKEIKKDNKYYNVTRVGYSIVIVLGKSECTQNGNKVLANAGINNFIEIMEDGSVRCRAILFADENNKVNISNMLILIYFKEVYKKIIGEEIDKYFINAYKYEKLTVLKQFEPYFDFGNNQPKEEIEKFETYMQSHQEKYGENLIITGNRIPKSEYMYIDKKIFDNCNIEFNKDNLLSELFRTEYFMLGFIDEL